MGILTFGRSVLHVGVAIGFLAGCQGETSKYSFTPRTANAVVPLSSSGYKTLYRFKAGYDGESPFSGLTDVNGTLFGTTFFGGANFNGAVFSISASGTERILYSFKGAPDASLPEAGLLNLNGTLYGTTVGGGANSRGAIFSIDKSGTEKVVYSFQGYSSGDGASPRCDLIDVNGNIYGTTGSGGANDKGTVFKVTPSGSERVIYSFKGGKDGQGPLAGLAAGKGTLYGTTAGNIGGSGSLLGTVFSITTSGSEKVLYNFKGPPDGAYPWAALVTMNGTLYGTTRNGGTSGWGTVFSVATSGKEKVLHSFKGFADGQYPYAPLVAVNGSLYGTTNNGGRNSYCSYFGCGTVYSITTSGTEKVIYTFKSDPDGANPEAGLLSQSKVLYGTTTGGGYGYGTVFQLAP